MKKRTIVLLLLIATVAVLTYLCFRPYQETRQLQIMLPSLRAADQISNPDNIIKWLLPFCSEGTKPVIEKKATSTTISLENDSAILTTGSVFNPVLTIYSNGKNKQFAFSAIPDTINKGQTIIEMTYTTNWLKQWMGKDDLTATAINSFENLQQYLTDTKKLYGYEIEIVPVTDTSFLFLRQTVPLAQEREATKSIFGQLIHFAEQNHADYNGVRIFYSLKSSASITVFAGIGINSPIAIPESSTFQKKGMPAGKNLLMANYQGRYAGLANVYAALEQYKTDYGLISMAIPFQKYITDGYDFAPDDMVQAKVFYPIF